MNAESEVESEEFGNVPDEAFNEAFNDVSGDVSGDAIENVSDESQEEIAAKKPAKKPVDYHDKVQKRIDTLVYERNIERDENKKLKDRLEQLETKWAEQEHERSKGSIQDEISRLREEKIDFLESGSYKEAADIDDRIIELKIKQLEANAAPREAKRENVSEERREPTVNVNPADNYMPESMQNWLDQNDWYFNPKKATNAHKANVIYQNLLNAGYDPESEDTYAELDKLLSRNKTPPTSAPDRGNAIGNNAPKFTQADHQRLIDWGLDPNDKKVRAEYLKNKESNNG